MLPIVTYLGQTNHWAWSTEAHTVIRLGKNSSDYTLGNRFHFKAWGSRKLRDWLGMSGQIDAERRGNIEGANPGLNAAMAPTADPTLRGGTEVEFSIGMDVYVADSAISGNRLAIRFVLPLYESLEGPQLETNLHLTASWSWVF